jgi:hypothetical protein
LLRPIVETAIRAEGITKILVLLFSLGFAFIAVKAYLKKRTKRLFYVAFAFALFALQALLQVADIFYSPGYFFNPAAQAVAQLLIIGVLFVAIFRAY